jgi:hypothetical protein
MLKNNREKALFYVTLSVLIFMVLAAFSGGWPGANVSANGT